MTDWKEQYLAALEARDETEQANLDLYNYCTKIADEKAALLKRQAQDAEKLPAAPPPPPPLIGYGIPRFTSPPPVQTTAVVAQLRQDLATAQQERGDLQAKLEAITRDFDVLKTKNRSDTKRITQLAANVNYLTIKVRDKEEELRGKAKLVEDVQDENVTLHLQLNIAEENADTFRKENKELVDRWMAQKGEEARKMNEEGRFT